MAAATLTLPRSDSGAGVGGRGGLLESSQGSTLVGGGDTPQTPRSAAASTVSVSASAVSLSNSHMTNGPDSPPQLSFDPSVFEAPEFDVDEFVSSSRKVVPLTKLKEELESHFRTVSAELVDLINRDYADFVSLSSDLVGLDKATDAVRAPLVEARGMFEEVGGVVDETIESVEAKLRERQAILERKTVLERFVSIAASVDKGRDSVEIRGGAGAAGARGGSDTLSETAVIERVAAELNQLHYLVSGDEDLPFIAGILPRVDVIEQTLEARLEAAFLEALDTVDESLLILCLRTYSTISKTRQAEKVFSNVVVTPFLEENVTVETLEGGVSGSCDGLSSLYDSVVELLGRVDVAAVLRLSADPALGFDFYTNALWAPLALRLGGLHQLFAPGLPPVFHANFTRTEEFLNRFESLAPKPECIANLRASKSYSDFMKKWKLPVYFQLRFQGIAHPVDTALNESKERPVRLSEEERAEAQTAALNPLLKPTVVTWTSIESAWDPSVFLTPLADKFLKLTLQMLQRYEQWVLADELNVSPAEAAAVVNDTLYCIGRLEGLVDLMTESLAGYGVGRELLADCLAEVRNGFEGAVTHAEATHIVPPLVRDCTSVLGSMDAIPAAYRRTGLAAPTSASDYVDSIVKPLVEFRTSVDDDAGAAGLPDTYVTRWATRVVQDIMTTMTEKAEKILQGVRAADEALARLKKNTAAGTGGPSDTDKIVLQLKLDVESLGSQVASEFGVDVEGLEEYAGLLAVVTGGGNEASGSGDEVL